MVERNQSAFFAIKYHALVGSSLKELERLIISRTRFVYTEAFVSGGRLILPIFDDGRFVDIVNIVRNGPPPSKGVEKRLFEG